MIALCLWAAAFAAVDLNFFHQANFNSSGDYCGVHIRVSGSRFYFSDIIPPWLGPVKTCGYFHRCNGNTFVLNCRPQSGDCVDSSGKVVVTLLPDGSFFQQSNGTMKFFANRGQFQYCRN